MQELGTPISVYGLSLHMTQPAKGYHNSLQKQKLIWDITWNMEMAKEHTKIDAAREWGDL